MDVKPLILFVDDEEDLCMLMQMSLSRMGIDCHIAHGVYQARKLLQQQQYDACLTDLNMLDGSGLELVAHIAAHYPQLPVAVLSAYGNMDIAIAALKAGAFDFVSKPVNQVQLQQLLTQALNQPIQAADLPKQQLIEEQMLIGHSSAIQHLRQTIQKIARSQAPVFIHGESGTGKEVVANLVHKLSNRHQGPFVAINCGAIPTELMESELFGHKKGSFTGANQDKQGLLQAADGGSLFLDELAELPLAMQVKLLRAVQEKKIRPIGGEQEIAVDFRIISATHQNLEQLVQQGKFRQDLFFRIHVMDLYLPPLRERGEDILLLAQHFIEKISQEWQISAKVLTPAARDFLLQQHFPGNVRELRNIMERALTLCDSDQIDIEHLQGSNARNLSILLAKPVSPIQDVPVNLHNNIAKQSLPQEGLEQHLENIEKQILLDALNLTHWNRTLAAKKLGMSFRSLRYRLKKFGLDTEDE
ncbi:sigma-54 dependent transcriptional regulator [Acinetobacter sp. B51(2017)]|uniref:sigma-54-dependent transcriptional regulator n=1 Tax=Acinetobacter sp. B51(2017) TaxID=2060938 RepID=UPI000F076915|nr:sigma-54 dependent transcriptional regulator [Acinetobacter sp. B51(2017)]